MFALAPVVRLLANDRGRVVFTSVLGFVGVAVSTAGVCSELDPTADPFFAVLFPVVIVEGTATLEVRELWRNAGRIGAFTIPPDGSCQVSARVLHLRKRCANVLDGDAFDLAHLVGRHCRHLDATRGSKRNVGHCRPFGTGPRDGGDRPGNAVTVASVSRLVTRSSFNIDVDAKRRSVEDSF